MADAVIRRLSIEAFRAFNERQEFDLRADVVIVRGPNGTGKTSFFDAIQWLLVGSIRHLEPFRTRRNTEHIVNVYSSRPEATVAADLELRGERIELRRSGSYRGSVLEFRNGMDVLRGKAADAALAEWLAPNSEISLDAALLASGLIQQDALRESLQTSASDRYAQISQLLGLGVLAEFEAHTRRRSETANADARSAQDEAEVVRGRRREAAEILAGQEALAAARPSAQDAYRSLRLHVEGDEPFLVELPDIPDANWASALSGEASRVAQELNSLAATTAEWARNPPEVAPGSAAQLRALEVEYDASIADLEELQRLHDVAIRDLAELERAQGDVERLVAAALPLIESDECPLCGQPVNPEHLRAELRQRVADSGRFEAAHAERERAANAVRAALDESSERRRAIDDLAAALSAQASYAANGDEIRQRLAELSSSRLLQFRASLDTLDPASLLTASRRASAIAGAARELAVVIEASSSSEVSRLRAAITELDQTLSILARSVEATSQTRESARAIHQATTTARTRVTADRFDGLRPLVADIFERLAPHPTFTEVDLDSGVYRSRGEASPLVRDRIARKDADPLILFSASQANITALAYFLAMGWGAGTDALPFVLLDDPLQAMDDINVLGFADLCRHLRRARQLLISVHERRFGALLERKLAPRRTGEAATVLEFLGWNRSGPTVKTLPVEDQESYSEPRVVAQ